VSRARFESKLMQASTAYRMTVYGHQPIRLDRTSSQLPLVKIESAPGNCSVKLLKLKRCSVPASVRGEVWQESSLLLINSGGQRSPSFQTY
jgi:hypothetical protein